MQGSDVRVALVCGNYNYVLDGSNKALNRLMGYMLRQGVAVRVYAPTVDEPAFEAVGDLVSVPSVAIPKRPEYRFPLYLTPRVKADMAAFAPTVVHLASPDLVSRQARAWASARDLPVVCSVHTRFETYCRYYNMAWLEPLMVVWLRHLYRRCDCLLPPSESFAQVLRDQRMNYDIDIWSRGVDRGVFNAGRRDMAWRRSLGIADDQPVIGFLGRLVLEKGLDVFSDSIDVLRRRGVPHRVLVVGEGPARGWLEGRLPDAVFAGFLQGEDLARAVASMDMLFNPSVTETFGNVTLEAMACGVPVVAARATGSDEMVADNVAGRLVRPGAIHQFADALTAYCLDGDLRAAHAAAALDRASHYDWDVINQTVLDTYCRLMIQRQRGGRGITPAVIG